MPAPDGHPDQVDTLAEINIDDLLDALGLLRWRDTPLRRLFQAPARRFARIAAEFDRRAGADGLAAGSAWMVQRMSGGLDVLGQSHVPPSGPVCVVSNHPGMTDTVALIASLASRPDLRIIALDRPFLRALPAVARQLLFVPEDGGDRLAVLRAAVAHLRRGGALLTFPAARIEPDPAVFGAPRARQALAGWSPGFAVLARRVPGTCCVPALVSQVLDPRPQRHPLVRLRRGAEDRERLAAALQVLLARYRHGRVRVAFGPPPCGNADDAQALRADVLETMARLIDGAAPTPAPSSRSVRIPRAGASGSLAE